jgi:hypothetical protein
MVKKIAFVSKGPGKRKAIRFFATRPETRSKEIDAWIERTIAKKNNPVRVYDDYEDIRKHEQRKKFFLVSGIFAILLTMLASFSAIFHLSFLRPIQLTMSFVLFIICYRLYDRVKNLYQAALYSGFIVVLFDSWVIGLWYLLQNKFSVYIFAIPIMVILFSVVVGCIYIADVLLNAMWNKI